MPSLFIICDTKIMSSHIVVKSKCKGLVLLNSIPNSLGCKIPYDTGLGNAFYIIMIVMVSSIYCTSLV